MLDQEKVIQLTELAIMEKRTIKKDKQITGYYEEDYVYVNNFKTRVMIFLAVGLGSVANLLWRVEKGLDIPTTRDALLGDYVIPYASVLVIALMLYTFLSTCVYKKKYRQAAQRMAIYEKLKNEVEEKEAIKIKEAKIYANKRRTINNEAENTTVL